jgi:2-amino-4-hydroxy-6-hydroxymethyldihydropteridine diphosphokinase
MWSQQSYTVSLGSNVRPEENIGAMLTALLGLGELLWMGRIVRTAPVGMLPSSTGYFLNTAVCLSSPLSPKQLKQAFCHIETELGRDRTDPLSKLKDRPADLDIVAVCGLGEGWDTAVLPPEPYIRPLVIELWQAQGYLHHLPPPPLSDGIPLHWHNRTIGLYPLCLVEEALAVSFKL